MAVDVLSTNAVAQCNQALMAFTTDPTRHIARVRRLLEDARERMMPCAIQFVETHAWGEWTATLLNLLVVHGLADEIVDSGRYSLRDAVEIARRAVSVDKGFDTRLVRVAMEARVEDTEGRRRLRRSLDILGALPRNERMLPMLIRFLRYPDGSVRSKAVLLAVRAKRDAKFAHPYLQDQDARVRANAVEGLWGVADPEIRATFYCATMDEHPRVVANAVVGLLLSKDETARELLQQMLESGDPRRTASAVWAIGRCRQTAFLPVVRELAQSRQPGVRRAALQALVRINSCPDQCGE